MQLFVTNEMVRDALQVKLGGQIILDEYDKMTTLTESTRRQLVNLLVADMVEIHGTSPPSLWEVKMLWASSLYFQPQRSRLRQWICRDTSMTHRVDLATWPGG